MVYSGTLIAVKDIQRSRQFYEDVFGLTVRHDYGINLSFDCNLALQQDFDWLTGVPKDSIVCKSNNFELYFEEEDFDAFLARLKELPQITLVHDVKDYPWGQRVIRLYDPDSHIIEVGESMKNVANRFLSSGLTIEETAQSMGVSVQDVELMIQ